MKHMQPASRGDVSIGHDHLTRAISDALVVWPVVGKVAATVARIMRGRVTSISHGFPPRFTKNVAEMAREASNLFLGAEIRLIGRKRRQDAGRWLGETLGTRS